MIMMEKYSVPGEIKLLMNYIYEYSKGVRNLILYTLNKSYEKDAEERLVSLDIPYIKQDAGINSFNLYFGKKECVNAIRLIVDKPLNLLSPEEDFILGALLGYDIRMQCERYCDRKVKN